jgi:hypothetical protein
MYVKRLRIENIRSVKLLDLQLPPNRLPGWHVILGDNGSGKSSVIRALALVLIGPEDAAATRQDWSRWLRNDADEGTIIASVTTDSEVDQWTGSGKTSKQPAEPRVHLKRDVASQSKIPVEISFTGKYAQRTLWAGASGWFAASFGPFRRFSGGDKDYDRLYYSNPRLAPHLSAFGEDVALTEALRWLQQLQFRALEKSEDAIRIRDSVIEFLNRSNLLPHGAKIDRVTSQEVVISDANGALVAVEQMSDGYRSILSLTFELLRGMTRSYGPSRVLDAIDPDAGCIKLPGVVAIDEVDAHLHPAWQKRIGQWFVERFPEVQFFVTTHSPIICRAAELGTIWRLPTPGSDEAAEMVEGPQLQRRLYGDILDAYGTEFFGEEVTRSQASKDKLMELARLNRAKLKRALTTEEKKALAELQAALPSEAATTADD